MKTFSHNKKLLLSDKIKKELITRLNRVEGQIRGIAKMVMDDVYCDKILNQVTSAQSALNGTRILLLENHINTCVIEEIVEGKYEVIGELMKTISRMTK